MTNVQFSDQRGHPTSGRLLNVGEDGDIKLHGHLNLGRDNSFLDDGGGTVGICDGKIEMIWGRIIIKRDWKM